MQKLRGLGTFVLICFVLATCNVVAEAASTVVISQLYTGPVGPDGFVELFNRGTDSVTMDGWTIQTSGPDVDASWTKAPLSGTIGPGQYYLIRVSINNSRIGAPAPDV